MKTTKDIKQNIFKILRRFKWLILSLFTVLVTINILLTAITGNAQSPSTTPNTATFDAFRGIVRFFPKGDRSSYETPAEDTELKSVSSSRPDILWVAGTSPDSVFESWAHLRLWRGTTPVDPIVQAGTNPTATEYTFPCGPVIFGSGVIGWGIKNQSAWGCDKIDLQHPAWKRSDLNTPYLAEKSNTKESRRKTEIAQNNSIQSRVTISRDKDLTLVYAHNLDGDLAIDVLVGAIKVQTANNQSQIVLVPAGTRYVYFGGIKPETTSNINPSEIAKLRPVQIFLDSTNWGKDIEPLIERFQQLLIASEPPSPIAQEILDAHNKCRAKVNVPPLQWSSKVAAYAQEWTDKLSSTGGFEHRQNNIYGENLAGGDLPPTDVVNRWCDEEEKYNPETGQCRGDDPMSCYHYTQVVWKNTTQLGCGTASHSQWGKVWVCNYNPPGNFVGQRPY